MSFDDLVQKRQGRKESVNDMLWTIAIILLVLWLLGLLTSIGGGLIHILLVVALVIVIIRLLQGRKIL